MSLSTAAKKMKVSIEISSQNPFKFQQIFRSNVNDISKENENSCSDFSSHLHTDMSSDCCN